MGINFSRQNAVDTTKESFSSSYASYESTAPTYYKLTALALTPGALLFMGACGKLFPEAAIPLMGFGSIILNLSILLLRQIYIAVALAAGPLGEKWRETQWWRYAAAFFIIPSVLAILAPIFLPALGVGTSFFSSYGSLFTGIGASLGGIVALLHFIHFCETDGGEPVQLIKKTREAPWFATIIMSVLTAVAMLTAALSPYSFFMSQAFWGLTFKELFMQTGWLLIGVITVLQLVRIIEQPVPPISYKKETDNNLGIEQADNNPVVEETDNPNAQLSAYLSGHEDAIDTDNHNESKTPAKMIVDGRQLKLQHFLTYLPYNGTPSPSKGLPTILRADSSPVVEEANSTNLQLSDYLYELEDAIYAENHSKNKISAQLIVENRKLRLQNFLANNVTSLPSQGLKSTLKYAKKLAKKGDLVNNSLEESALTSMTHETKHIPTSTVRVAPALASSLSAALSEKFLQQPSTRSNSVADTGSSTESSTSSENNTQGVCNIL